MKTNTQQNFVRLISIFVTFSNYRIKLFERLSKQRLLYLSVALLLSYSSYCQNTIVGKVVDDAGGPMTYANILLLNALDSSFLKGEIASEDGSYIFEKVPKGNYLCEISMVGYPRTYSERFEFSKSQETKDLGLTVLSESLLLQSVEIVAKRAFLEQKIDRTVINVSNSITNAGGNALEVLQRSPGIQVNRLTKSISLVGKEGVVIMINGKISRMPSNAVVQMLEGMNASNIDRIELIHTPPANFEAEGNAGIINIVLKNTGDEGLNGSYAVNLGRGRGDKYGGSINFNYRYKAINLYGGYDRNYNLNPQVFTNYRGVYQGNDFLETESYSDRSHTPTTGQNARIGMDFQLSKNTVLGVLTTLYDNNWYMEAVNSATYSKNGTIESQIVMPNVETNKANSVAANINLTHKLSKNQSINIDADLIRYRINNPSKYDINHLINENLVPQYSLRIDKKTPINIGVLKFDYTYDINDNIKFETGAKYTKMGFDNDVIVDSLGTQASWINLGEYTSYSRLDENVTGTYATFSAKINDKTDLKAGLRYEYTNTNLSAEGMPNIVDRHYPSWFPSVFINHKLSTENSLNLSFSRRITRPRLTQLAAFLVFSDPTTLLGGNPTIQPSFTNTLKLDLGIKSVRFGLSYSIENNPIGPVPIINTTTNIQVNTWKNLNNTKVANLNIYLPIHPKTWWDISSNFFVNNSSTSFDLENKDFKVQNFNYGFNINNTVKLPNNYNLEISGNYNSPGYWGVSKWSATGALNVGVQKELSETWGKLNFSVNDIFQSTNWYGTTDQPDVNILVDVSFRFAERVFMLTWSNTFGSKKLKSQRNRQTGSAEEVRRI